MQMPTSGRNKKSPRSWQLPTGLHSTKTQKNVTTHTAVKTLNVTAFLVLRHQKKFKHNSDLKEATLYVVRKCLYDEPFLEILTELNTI
jgi:hypothetical protein